MSQKDTTLFQIYRSSAGSGKTYTLALEFIALALEKPHLATRILAVTFTNKATREMKERIIKFLTELAAGKNNALKTQLSQKTGLSEDLIQKNAGSVLKRILHQYSNFNVSTIDAFFQKIVKSFAREIGLLGNFKVELDTELVKQDIVDMLIEDIGLEGKEMLTDWLVEFSNDQVDDSKSWDVRPSILQLSKEIFKENFNIIYEDLMYQNPGKQNFKTFIAQLKGIVIGFENIMFSIGKEGKMIMDKHGITPDDCFQKSKGPGGYFYRLIAKKKFTPNKYVLSAYTDPGKWTPAKSSKKAQLQQALNFGLQDSLVKAVEYYETQSIQYNSAKEVLKNFYVFGILADLIEKLRIYRQENDLMLISDIPVFLKSIIADNDAPFIYEKTGSWFRHFLIDEFQDTSGYQWYNFKPLIQNSLSEGHKNLVVGDGKQSIYRWRGSDWDLILKTIADDLRIWSPQEEVLDTNWRSLPKVIHLNNHLFTTIPGMLRDHYLAELSENTVDPYLNALGDDLMELYKDVEQKVSDSKSEGTKTGFFRISFFREEEEKNITENILNSIPATIEEIQNAGYQANDICILVRRSVEGRRVIETLNAYKNTLEPDVPHNFEVISNESLFLNNHPAIRLLVSAFRYLNNPDDSIARAELHHYISLLKTGTEGSEHLSVMDFSSQEGFDVLLQLENSREILLNLPLYEMTENLIRLFRIGDSGAYPFLTAFQNVILQVTDNKNVGIQSFLEWWDDKGSDQSIQVQDDIDAIRVMTIHKAKGLEFKVVLVPFCDWKINQDGRTILWCNTDKPPFNKIKYLPLKYSNELANTHFAPQYFSEKIKSYIDNTNLLYVALTRAGEALFINAPMPKSAEIKCIADVLYPGVKSIKDETLNDLILSEETDRDVFQCGNLSNPEKTSVTSKEPAVRVYNSNEWRNKLKIVRRSKDFFREDFSEKEERIHYGLVVHDVLSKVRSIQEIAGELAKYQTEGLINDHDRQILREHLRTLFSDREIRSWFEGDWEVKAEVPILTKSGHPKRPDRVLIKDNRAIIIDFKTGKEQFQDKSQVLEYCELLKQMNYKIEGAWLLYISLTKKVQVI